MPRAFSLTGSKDPEQGSPDFFCLESQTVNSGGYMGLYVGLAWAATDRWKPGEPAVPQWKYGDDHLVVDRIGLWARVCPPLV